MKEISSIAEYLEYLNNIKDMKIHQRYVGSFTFFRGQANKDWILSPSLYRSNTFEQEGLMLEELSHICPKEFEGNRFEILAKMQHFGLPTRLLDTTTNPLVALYFACKDVEERKNDGVVYIFPNLPVSWSDDPLVDLIMDYVFDYSSTIWLEEMLRRTKKKYANVVGRAMPERVSDLLHYLTIPAFGVMPRKNNSRIRAQDGAFLVFGMECAGKTCSDNPGTLGREYYKFSPITLESSKQLSSEGDAIIIPANCKENVLEQLDILSINEHKLFPDLAHQTEYVFNIMKKLNK